MNQKSNECDGPLICGHCDKQVGTHADDVENTIEVSTRVPEERPEDGWKPGDVVSRPFVGFQSGQVQRVGKVLTRERHYITGGIVRYLLCVEWLDGQVQWGYTDEGLFALDAAALGGMHTLFSGDDRATYALLTYLLSLNVVTPKNYWAFHQEEKLQFWIKSGCRGIDLIEYFGIRMHRVHVWDDMAKTWCESSELQDLLNDSMDSTYKTVYWPDPKYRLERVRDGKDPMPVVRLTQTADELSDPADREELSLGKDQRKDYKVPQELWGVTDDEVVLDWFHTTIPIGCVDDYQWEVVRGETAQVPGSEGGDEDNNAGGDGLSD